MRVHPSRLAHFLCWSTFTTVMVSVCVVPDPCLLKTWSADYIDRHIVVSPFNLVLASATDGFTAAKGPPPHGM